MRLNQDIIRSLLLEAEGEEPVDLSPYSSEQITYHKVQLIEAQYVKGFIHSGLGNVIGAEINDLTWEGHQFLANARNHTVWNQVKEQVAKHGGSVGLKVVEVLAGQIALDLFK